MVKNLAVVGCGQRGKIYMMYALTFPEEFKLVAVCDNDEKRLEYTKNRFKPENSFSDYKDFIKSGIKADLVAVSTQDESHKEIAIALMEAGYDLLLEKPIANNEADCMAIYKVAKKYKRTVYVCHVLRYSPFFSKVKEVIDSGEIGEIINISSVENVGYYHQAHSFVRGPWRNKKESSPMILAKCCHDLDLLNFLMGERCEIVSSFGNLKFFTPKYAPEGHSKYCSDCKVEDCVFRAQKLYKEYRWMANYFAAPEDDDETVAKKLVKTQYDKCVFETDNDVVDHQVVNLSYANGKTASHLMCAFSREIYRELKVMGTKGEIEGSMESGKFEVRLFGGDVKTYDIDITAPVGGHGGSDYNMMKTLYKALNGEKVSGVTSIDVSVSSHVMCFAAEESRLKGGKPIKIKI